jgi:hypothetical protein
VLCSTSLTPVPGLHRAAGLGFARFAHAALTAELPPGWHTQPDHLRHAE